MSRNERGNWRTEWPIRFDACLAFTLREEGGYVDDPADPGGATNMGITLATYRQWSDDPELGSAQVQDMTERTARAIYRSLYWNPLRADALPIGVDLSVFDMGVNAGIWRIGQAAAAGASASPGKRWTAALAPRPWTPQRSAIRARSSTDLAERQAAYYRSLADFPTFGTGWLNRTEARRECGARDDRAKRVTRQNLCGLDAFCNNLCVVTSGSARAIVPPLMSSVYLVNEPIAICRNHSCRRQRHADEIRHAQGDASDRRAADDRASLGGAAPAVAGRDGRRDRAADGQRRRGPSLRRESVVQDPPLGTGDAVRTAMRALDGRLAPQGSIDDVLVLYGDTPFLATETLSRLLAERRRTAAAVLVSGMRPADPGPYGRFVLAPDGALERIVEAADAGPEEQAIGLVNGGIMVIEARRLGRIPRCARQRQRQARVLPDRYRRASPAARARLPRRRAAGRGAARRSTPAPSSPRPRR